METTSTLDLVMLDPSQILADENIRFSLKTSKVNSLAEKIREAGGVNDPIEVMPLTESQNGHDYRLSVGHYRLAACIQLRNEGMTIQIPAIIRERSETDRLLRQVSENSDRENLSPMDCAVTFKKMIDMGIPKMDIRKVFSRPGGAKGSKVQPISNALLNMYVSFLDFPKGIQSKIHLGPEEGGIGVATAYTLYKTDREKWDVILAKAEADRLAALEQEENDEKKFLAQEKKVADAAQKSAEEEAKLKAAREAAEKAKADLTAKQEASIRAYEAAKTETDDKAREEKEAQLKKAEEEGRAAERAAAAAKKELDKAEGRVKSAAQLAEERRKKLEAARKEEDKATKKKASPKPADVQKAAKELGGKNFISLNAAQIRESINTLTLPGTTPKVMQLAEIIKEHISGVTTPGQFYKKLQVLMGEFKEKAKK